MARSKQQCGSSVQLLSPLDPVSLGGRAAYSAGGVATEDSGEGNALVDNDEGREEEEQEDEREEEEDEGGQDEAESLGGLILNRFIPSGQLFCTGKGVSAMKSAENSAMSISVLSLSHISGTPLSNGCICICRNASEHGVTGMEKYNGDLIKSALASGLGESSRHHDDTLSAGWLVKSVDSGLEHDADRGIMRSSVMQMSQDVGSKPVPDGALGDIKPVRVSLELVSRDAAASESAREWRLPPVRLVAKYSHRVPRFAQRAQDGLFLLQRTLDLAQASQLSRSLGGLSGATEKVAMFNCWFFLRFV